METKVVSEKENPLLKRKEIIIMLDYDGGPTTSKAALQTLLAGKFSAEPQQIEISKILSENGMSRGKAWIKVWEDKRAPIYSELKKAPAEKPAEAKPEKVAEKKEAPKEEKKEEKK